jgi:hypothetical protein
MSSLRLGVVLLAALVPNIALAQSAETVTGKLLAGPLRIDSRPFDAPPVLGERLTAAASLSPTVSVELSGATLVSIDGRTTSDAPLLASTAIGAATLASLKANTTVTITDAVTSGSVYYKVSAGAATGWLGADLVQIGYESETGNAIGKVLAPAFAGVSALRSARTFHPDGVTYTGKVTSLGPPAPFDAAAQKLEGAALSRFGVGIFKTGAPAWLPDATSIATRFCASIDGVNTHPGDEDILATAGSERFRTIGLAPFHCNKFDYFANDYFPMEPMKIANGTVDVWVRLAPVPMTLSDPSLQDPKTAADREGKLALAVKENKAKFHLEVQRTNTSITREWLGIDLGTLVKTGSVSAARAENPWIPLVEIDFDTPLAIDQETLHFNPDLTGRGLVPHGIIAAIRSPVYRASQDARPATAADRAAAEKEPLIPRAEGVIKALGKSLGGN